MRTKQRERERKREKLSNDNTKPNEKLLLYEWFNSIDCDK